MLLGGLWHGAGWTFVIWGGLHGLYLIINHAWQETTARLGWAKGGRFALVFSVLLTFLCTNIAWVFFRAPDINTAFSVLRGIFGLNGAAIPAAILTRLDMLQPLTEALHIGTFLGGGANFIANYLWIAAAAFITFAFPNTQELLRRYVPALPDSRQAKQPAFALIPLRWKPTAGWAIAIGLAGAAGALSLTRPSEFLYFQF
jgi:hypothetical protein